MEQRSKLIWAISLESCDVSDLLRELPVFLFFLQIIRKPLHVQVRTQLSTEDEVSPPAGEEQNLEDVKMAFFKIIEAFKVCVLACKFIWGGGVGGVGVG